MNDHFAPGYRHRICVPSPPRRYGLHADTPTSGPEWPALRHSHHGDAPALSATCAAPASPVSALQIQLKKYNLNNQIKFFKVNAQFSMLSAHDRFLLITFDTVMQKGQPRNKVSRKANGKCAPGSGRSVGAYIRIRCKTGDDPFRSSK